VTIPDTYEPGSLQLTSQLRQLIASKNRTQITPAARGDTSGRALARHSVYAALGKLWKAQFWRRPLLQLELIMSRRRAILHDLDQG
jgi:hypothetical protein